MILIAVVVGLALAELLNGMANLLRVRETVRFHWIHVPFQLGVFFALMQQWWESWDLVDVGIIGFGSVLSILQHFRISSNGNLRSPDNVKELPRSITSRTADYCACCFGHVARKSGYNRAPNVSDSFGITLRRQGG